MAGIRLVMQYVLYIWNKFSLVFRHDRVGSTPLLRSRFIDPFFYALSRVINDATRTPRIRHWGKTYSNSTDKVVWVGLSMK